MRGMVQVALLILSVCFRYSSTLLCSTPGDELSRLGYVKVQLVPGTSVLGSLASPVSRTRHHPAKPPNQTKPNQNIARRYSQ